MDKDTVSTYFVGAAVATLDVAARARVLAEAGIAPELAATASARVPAAAFARLWLAVSQVLDDEFFGLDARRLKVGSFALVSRAAITATRLDDALRVALRGWRVLLDDVGGSLRVDGPQAVLAVDNRIADPQRHRFADETFLVLVHGLTCWLASRRIPLRRAAFAQPEPAHAAEYAVMFTPELAFGAPRTELWFDAHWLDAPVAHTPASLKAFLRHAPQSVFLRYKNADSAAARLRRRLRDGLSRGEWPRFEDVAAELDLAPTTLRRRLESEGTSYQAIKDTLRRDAAIDHLCGSRLSIAEIAEALGFREPSAFHRAFKKWCGVQPGAYRSGSPPAAPRRRSAASMSSRTDSASERR